MSAEASTKSGRDLVHRMITISYSSGKKPEERDANGTLIREMPQFKVPGSRSAAENTAPGSRSHGFPNTTSAQHTAVQSAMRQTPQPGAPGSVSAGSDSEIINAAHSITALAICFGYALCKLFHLLQTLLPGRRLFSPLRAD